jgi:predicted N-formylglutamate amidohydrolase
MWDQRQRKEFLLIAERARNEVCASYTLVSLGLQAYEVNRRFRIAAAAQPEANKVEKLFESEETT